MRRKYKQVKAEAVPDLLKKGVAIVDVRRQEEWQLTGIVAGSELLTFFDAQGQSQPEEWLQQLNALVPDDHPLALICRTGHRTSLICEYLVEVTSRAEIYNVADGIFGWLGAGLPVVSVNAIP